MTEMKRDHAIEQSVLGAIDAGVLGRVRGEDGPKPRMDVDVAFASPVQSRNVEDALRQDAQERVVGFRLGPIEFVVNDRMPEPTSGGDAVVDPQRAPLLFELDDRGDVIVDDARLAIAALATDQVGTAELMIAMDQDGGPAELSRDVEGERRLPGAGGPDKCTA